MPDHQMTIHMLGNSWIYISCVCLKKRRGPRPVYTTKTVKWKNRAPLSRSLGDFPVGTPVGQLLEAFTKHVLGTAEKPTTSMGYPVVGTPSHPTTRGAV